ncbi:MAG: hypothetical protein HPY62_01790 [Bacteroidales bacterium]|nr:hypothetical protein [Bacteroidales bacterium]
MRISVCLLLVCITVSSFTQGEKDNARRVLEPALSVSLNSNGIASIPAFSLGKPAIIASVNLTKGRFSYDPVLAYSLEMKPWFIDSWLHYKIILKPKFELRAGVNFSTFCSGFAVNDEEILKAERYFAFALAGTYRLSAVSSLTLDYWSDNGQEKGSLSGHFASLTYDNSEISIGKKVYSSLNVMLFYIGYEGDNDGLFISPRIAFSIRNIPSSIFFQATQVIQSNILPSPGFRWNVGISYSL